ncbi:hypothetical protein M8J77_012813 [Diaphorina citri]|nr:hypothetical protein M8J77_012813 [Diaphorina citri]
MPDMIRRLAILLSILAEFGRCKRTTTTQKMALRHMNENVNWSAENIEFQKIFDKIPDDVTFHREIITVLPTLKYQRGVNLTAYEINIRKEQAKLDKIINERQKDIDAREAKWKSIRDEMAAIRKNITWVRRTIQNTSVNQRAVRRKKQLVQELSALKTRYNITPEPRDTFDFAYNKARLGVVRLLKRHTRLVMNRTKFFYDFILRKNELSDELYDLRENMTQLDMLINEKIELETLAPSVRIKDVMQNLTAVVRSINVKGYKYKRTKRGLLHLVSLLNRFLNKSKHEELDKKRKIPPAIAHLNDELRNLSAHLRKSEVLDNRIKEMQKILKQKNEEYHDVKYYYYRKLLNLREVKMERFNWEMNLTNYLKETVRRQFLEMVYSPEIDFYLKDESSINMRENLIGDMIEHEKYYLRHLRYNRTTTMNYEWQEALAFDEDCKKYIHDNWWSFESLKHKYDKKKRKRRRRNVVKDVRR